MEITTHLHYNHDRHTVVDYLKKNFEQSSFPLYNPIIVRKMISNSNSTDAIFKILRAPWSPILMVPGKLIRQMIPVKLSGGAWMHVYLLSTGKFRDRGVLIMHGAGKETLYMYMGFVGETDVFNKMIEGMNINELEAHMGADHYISDEDEA